MDIANQLKLLKKIKDDIKSAIISKGVEVLASTPFSSYADKISSIIALTDLGEKTITKNGTYFPSDDDMSGYNKVIVNVQAAPIAKDIVTRECISNYHCSTVWALNDALSQSSGTLSSQMVYTGNGGYIDIDEELDLSTANSWKIETKFTYVAGDDPQFFIGRNNSSNVYSLLYTIASDKLQLCMSSDNSSFDIAEWLDLVTLTNGTTYWTVIEFTGTHYNVKISTDGINFTTLKSEANATKIYTSGYFRLANDSYEGYHCLTLSPMDLVETKFYINNNLVLQCATKGTPIF